MKQVGFGYGGAKDGELFSGAEFGIDAKSRCGKPAAFRLPQNTGGHTAVGASQPGELPLGHCARRLGSGAAHMAGAHPPHLPPNLMCALAVTSRY
jgi:hypothetical protein